MKVIVIGCNTDGSYDGIGKHARIISEQMKEHPSVESVTLISGRTKGFHKLKKIFSLEMTHAFQKACSVVSEGGIDFLDFEYPFDEFDPWIITAFLKLRRTCHQNGCRIALSMHEYDRVKPLRKAVIRIFLRYSDLVYVSEEKYFHSLSHLNKNLFLRRIPNHIPLKTENVKAYDNHFVYFGLVNKSKAFDEMVQVWDTVNKDAENHLDIVTISDISLNEEEHKGITVHKGLSEEDAAAIMEEATFSVCAIKPCVGYNNSSFVSSVQCGCIPIGCFDDSLKDMDFVIHSPGYDREHFSDAFLSALQMDFETRRKKSMEAKNFGSQFTIENTVNQMVAAMESLQ